MKPLNEWIESLFAGRPPHKLLFRVDAGRIKGLSFGHLSRCLTLARACRSIFGTRCVFAMRNLAEGVDHALGQGETVWRLDSDGPDEGGAAQVVQAARRFAAQTVLTDLPYTDMDWGFLEELNRDGRTTVVLDDFRFANPGADVYHNSSILAPENGVTSE